MNTRGWGVTARLLVLAAVSASGPVATAAAGPRLCFGALDQALVWNAPREGGPVAEYRVKCGPEPGNYTLPVARIAPPATRLPVERAVPGPGTYFCVVQAANQYGESEASNEVEVVLASAAQEAPSLMPAPSAPPATSVVTGFEDYRIGPEDSLFVSVWRNDVMSRAVVVRPDGRISLPVLNDVEAAGLTPAQLRDVLVAKLSEYMPDPDVAVIVTDVRSLKVSVIGEVVRPGRYEIRGRTTVLDALSLAGGLTAFASRSRIVVLRPDGNTTKRIPFDYARVSPDGFLDRVMAFGRREQDNFYLRPGDVVLVP